MNEGVKQLVFSKGEKLGSDEGDWKDVREVRGWMHTRIVQLEKEAKQVYHVIQSDNTLLLSREYLIMVLVFNKEVNCQRVIFTDSFRLDKWKLR